MPPIKPNASWWHSTLQGQSNSFELFKYSNINLMSLIFLLLDILLTYREISFYNVRIKNFDAYRKFIRRN